MANAGRKNMSASGPAIAIAGSYVGSPEAVLDRSLEEMIFDAAEATVASAGMSIDDVQGVVISATDELDGRVISCMVSSGPAGGVGRDLMMIASASEHALIYGYLRLLGGQGDNVLVLGWGKPSESVSPAHAELVAAEPFILRPHGMNDTVAAALQASVLVGAGDIAASDGDESEQFTSWPLTKADARPQGDAVCGVLLTTESAVPSDSPPVWLRGVGWATDRYELGDRDVAQMPALRTAASQAYGMASLDAAPVAASVRMHCPSPLSFDAALAALDLPRDRARLLNDSNSGSAYAYPSYAAGLATMVKAAQELREGRDDVDGGAERLAVGASLYGFAGQGAVVGVFGSSKGSQA